jgi:hypothetical protein
VHFSLLTYFRAIAQVSRRLSMRSLYTARSGKLYSLIHRGIGERFHLHEGAQHGSEKKGSSEVGQEGRSQEQRPQGRRTEEHRPQGWTEERRS